MSDEYRGRVVVVSGAASGLGRATAFAFAEAGARLVVVDVEPDRLRETELALGEAGTEVAAYVGDVADEATSERAVDLAVSRFGRLDVAVNNAGVIHPLARLQDIDVDVARRVVAVDLMGVFFALRHQIPRMIRQFEERGEGGAILNVASVAGVAAAPKMAVYAAAKHGVVGLTRSAAVEVARKGVRVNALCPASIRTPMAEAEPEAAAKLAAVAPMARLGEIEEVVPAILWACSPRNGFMTGATIRLDGGLHA